MDRIAWAQTVIGAAMVSLVTLAMHMGFAPF